MTTKTVCGDTMNIQIRACTHCTVHSSIEAETENIGSQNVPGHATSHTCAFPYKPLCAS